MLKKIDSDYDGVVVMDRLLLQIIRQNRRTWTQMDTLTPSLSTEMGKYTSNTKIQPVMVNMTKF